MERHTLWSYTLFFTLVVGQKMLRVQNNKTGDCALFKADTSYLYEKGESYLPLGRYDLKENMDIRFKFLPSRFHHNGILLAMGESGFQYYEWKTKAVKMEYFVIEIFYSALSMLLKAKGTTHMKQIEIHNNWPTSYDISDVKWHKVQVTRTKAGWNMTLDERSLYTPIVNMQTNVTLRGAYLSIGGRPGYNDEQFRGIIKNLRINGRKVAFRGRHARGLVEAWHCSAPLVQEYTSLLRREGTDDEKGHEPPEVPEPPEWLKNHQLTIK